MTHSHIVVRKTDDKRKWPKGRTLDIVISKRFGKKLSAKCVFVFSPEKLFDNHS